MGKAIVRYGNNSQHATMESISKLHRENATWRLQIGESVTIKSKSQLLKAAIKGCYCKFATRGHPAQKREISFPYDNHRSKNGCSLVTPFSLSFASYQNLAVHNYINPYVNYYVIC